MTELKSMKMSQLVELYNNLNPERAATMNTFKSKQIAMDRIKQLEGTNKAVERIMKTAAKTSTVEEKSSTNDKEIETEKIVAPVVTSVAGKGKIGNLIVDLLTQTDKIMSHADILEEIKSTFPKAKTSIGCVSWYASKLRKSGTRLPRKRSASTANG